MLQRQQLDQVEPAQESRAPRIERGRGHGITGFFLLSFLSFYALPGTGCPGRLPQRESPIDFGLFVWGVKRNSGDPMFVVI